MKRRHTLTSPVVCSLVLAVSALWPLTSHAFLSDDEARKAIIELRQRVEVNRQVVEANRQAAEAAASETREGNAVNRRSLLELANQIEQLRAELANLRGQNEQLAREVSDLQRLQKDAQSGLEERLRQVEPLRISHDGVSFSAAPSEKREFEAAMEALRRSQFDVASSAYSAFLRRYPDSGYTPSALYWLGNAQYAARAYKESLESHGVLVTRFPSHVRTPEAMLAMANSHVELKDVRSARRTLEDLVKAYPATEAADAGRERLARLR